MPALSVTLPMPHAGQQAVMKGARRFNWICAGRRWRKTSMCMVIVVEAALKGRRWIWGSPTYKQTRIGFEETIKAARGVASFNKSRMTAKFITGGYIQFVSLEKPDNVRGFTADGVVLDEVQNIRPNAYSEVIRPMLLDTGGEFWGIGTSNGNKDHFFQQRQRAYSDPLSMAWNIPTLGATIIDDKLVREPHPLENPFINFEELESMFNDMPRHVFRREILSDDSAAAGGLVYDVWLDGWPENKGGNVTDEADYIPDTGRLFWFVDQGYSGEYDHTIGTYTARSHPRVYLLAQMRDDGTLCIFDESYAVKTQDDAHLQMVRDKGYPDPDFAVVDTAAASLKGFLMAQGVYVQGKKPSVSEGISESRRWIGKDKNGRRRALVHPRCRHLRLEMASYRWGDGDKPIEEFDHGPDALRYGVWALRYE